MYKSLTANDYREYFGLHADYEIDGMLIYGTYNRPRQVSFLEEAMKGIRVELNSLPDFLGRMTEFVVDGKRYWFDVSYGGAQLSEYLHLACLFGSRANLLLGSCGGLDPRVDSCDLIVPTSSYGNESTTRTYSPQAIDHKHLPNDALSERIATAIGPTFKVWRGPTVTNQAMMGETLEDVQAWSNNGYLGVEMEAATVFAVSNHFAVPAAALLFVGDNLIRGETVMAQSFKDGRTRREGVVAGAISSSAGRVA
jgi:hypothetical protein